MIRQTSAEAYAYLVTSGRLSTSRAQVYVELYEHGPLTRNELDDRLARGTPNPTYSRRLSEMERMGLVRRVCVATCRITGRHADAWDVTDRVQPLDVPERRSPREALAQIRAILATPSARTFTDNAFDRIIGILDATEAPRP